MFGVAIILLIFVITVVIILFLVPDTMGEEETFKADVKNICGFVKICQTCNFGQPSLELKPAKRSVLLDLRFLSDDVVSADFPLLLKKQQKQKASYSELFTKHNLRFVELKNKFTILFNRKDENLGELITHLYKELFDAGGADVVRFKAKTLKSDMNILRLHNEKRLKFTDGIESQSSKFDGKSIQRIKAERISGAVYYWLYPPLVILSYNLVGLMGMCWTSLVFFGFFAFSNLIHKKQSIALSLANGSILYCILLSATLITNNIVFLQSIPSIIGASVAIISIAKVLGLSKPKSKRDIMQKQKNPKEFIFMNSFWVIGGFGLLAINEWARRSLNIDDWVYFFGFVRIELMIAMILIFTPAYAVYLHKTGNWSGSK